MMTRIIPRSWAALFSVLTIWVLPAWAWAASETAARAPQAPVSSSAHLLNVMLGLGLILLLILGLAWFVRRIGQGGLLNNTHMKVVAAMPLGTRERLMVVEVGGQQLLLGVTATQITTLHVFDEPVIDSRQPAPASEFSRKLMSLLQQKSAGDRSDTP